MRKNGGDFLNNWGPKLRSIMCVMYVLVFIYVMWQTFAAAKETWSIVMLGLFMLVIVAVLVFIFEENKELKKQQQIRRDKMLSEAYKPYIGLVHEEFQKCYNTECTLDPRWIREFDNLIELLTQILKPREITDFNIAACLMFALIYKSKRRDGIQLAIACAKQIIKEPKGYEFFYRKGKRLETMVTERYQKIPITILDSETQSDIMQSSISSHLSGERKTAIQETAYFLQMLYMRCKMLSEKNIT